MSLQRSLQKGRNGESGDQMTGLWQRGQATTGASVFVMGQGQVMLVELFQGGMQGLQ